MLVYQRVDLNRLFLHNLCVHSDSHIVIPIDAIEIPFLFALPTFEDPENELASDTWKKPCFNCPLGAAPDGDADALAGMLFAVLSLERAESTSPWLEEAGRWQGEQGSKQPKDLGRICLEKLDEIAG